MYTQKRALTGISTPVSGRNDVNDDGRQSEKRLSVENMGDNRNRHSTGFVYGITDLNFGSYQENFLHNNGHQQQAQLQGSPQRHQQQQIQSQIQQPQLVYSYPSYQYQMQYSSYPYLTYPTQLPTMQRQLQNQAVMGSVGDYNSVYPLAGQQTVAPNANYLVGTQLQTTGMELTNYPKERNVNIGTRSPIKQQHYGHVGHRSPVKNRADSNFSGDSRKFHYKEINSVDDIYREGKRCSTGEVLDDKFFKSYFKGQEIMDLSTMGGNPNNKAKYIINRLPKRQRLERGTVQSPGSILVYKLSKPFMSFNLDEGQAEISSLLRNLKFESHHQELMLGGDPNYRVDSLGEFTQKLFNRYMQKNRDQTGSTLMSTGTVGGAVGMVGPNIPKIPHMRTILNASAPNYNDSFDLSFDGKAMDRSDIFRIVDSFSVAFSDEDNTNNSSMLESSFNIGTIGDNDGGIGISNDGSDHEPVRKILPDEITKWQ